VEKKNRFHHDSIFRGIVIAGSVPEWVYDVVPRDELNAKKQAILEQRRAALPALDAEVAQSLALKAHTFEIVPVK